MWKRFAPKGTAAPYPTDYYTELGKTGFRRLLAGESSMRKTASIIKDFRNAAPAPASIAAPVASTNAWVRFDRSTSANRRARRENSLPAPITFHSERALCTMG